MYNLSVCRRTSHYLSAVLAPLLAACLFAPGTASALDFNVQPRINTGLMYYDFTQEPFAELQFQGQTATPSTATTEYSLSDLMPLVGGGATVFTGRFYLDVYAQKAFDGSDDATQGFIPSTGEFNVRDQFNSDWDREEYSVSIGYAVTDNLALYTGYRLSDTEFEQEGVVTQIGLADLPRLLNSSETLDFEQDGPFIGGTYGFRIGDTGTFGLNLAIAFVEGDIEDTLELRSQGQELIVGGLENNFTGDTVGTTIGLSWIAPLPIFQGFNYSIGVDGYQYSFEADEDANIGDLSETVIRGTAGVSYLF